MFLCSKQFCPNESSRAAALQKPLSVYVRSVLYRVLPDNLTAMTLIQWTCTLCGALELRYLMIALRWTVNPSTLLIHRRNPRVAHCFSILIIMAPAIWLEALCLAASLKLFVNIWIVYIFIICIFVLFSSKNI